MFAPDITPGAAAVAGVMQALSSRPQLTQRVVEDTARPELQQQGTGTLSDRAPTELQQLSKSARQFADLLDKTGNVQVASAISGFRAGRLDMYA
jgi:hypothetical protein